MKKMNRVSGKCGTPLKHRDTCNEISGREEKEGQKKIFRNNESSSNLKETLIYNLRSSTNNK